jgi:polyribonucleotide nucleotidyltransferase
MKAIVKSFEVGGQTITVETGKLAKQSDGAVVVKVGNTMLLATVVSSIGAREGVDFLPLSVDYQEKYFAVGKYPRWFLQARKASF